MRAPKLVVSVLVLFVATGWPSVAVAQTPQAPASETPSQGEKHAMLDRVIANQKKNDEAQAVYERIERLEIRKSPAGTPPEIKISRTVPAGTGIDHIPVHNTNEIAQSECATGHPFARMWVHGAFLNVVVGKSADKMSKSGENFITVQTLLDKGYDPLAYRYLCLTAHYRSELKFTWESLNGASKALSKVWELKARELSGDTQPLDDDAYARAREAVQDAVDNDLNLPIAVAELHKAGSYRLWSEFDPILGLDIEARSRTSTPAPDDDSALPEEVQDLKRQRDTARKEKNWKLSDELRAAIESHGYSVGDSPSGTTVKKALI